MQDYNLSSQIKRAAISNIAEGSSKTSQKDFNRFLEMALCSLFELETQIIFTQKHYPETKALREECLFMVNEEKKMIYTFKNKLNLYLNT